MSDKIETSNRVFTLLMVFLAGLFIFWGFRIYEIWNSSEGNYPREITVEGQASAFVVPDIGELRLGVNTEGADSAQVVGDNAEKINTITAELKKLGVEEKDIKTESYYLSPKYEWTETEGSYQDGYTLDQTLVVKIRDFSKAGEIISVASAAGANIFSGITYTVEDPDVAKVAARAEAIEKAKAKAELIEEASGLDLGKVIGYYEYDTSGYDYGKGGMYDMALSAEVPEAVPSISPGEQEVSLTVSLIYRVK